MRILTASITADAQVFSGDCYFVGADLYNAGDTSMIVYNENSASKTAAKKIMTIATTDEVQSAHANVPLPGVKCEGIYVDWTAGVGTIYYHV